MIPASPFDVLFRVDCVDQSLKGIMWMLGVHQLENYSVVVPMSNRKWVMEDMC